MKKKKKLNASDFRKLNDLIAKCAKCALEDSRKDFRAQNAYGISQVSDEDFSILWSCYENSDYYKGRKQEYLQFVEDEMRSLVQGTIGPCFKNKNRFEIMLPVIFYSLIVQNESNRATVARRENKVLSALNAGEPLPLWNLRDPYREWKKVYRPDADEEAIFANKITDISQQAVKVDLSKYFIIHEAVNIGIWMFINRCGCL